MQIVFNIDDFFDSVFPEIKGKTQIEIIEFLNEYFSKNYSNPIITINGNTIVVEVESSKDNEQTTEYKQALALCDKQRFVEAKAIIEKLIKQNPTDS